MPTRRIPIIAPTNGNVPDSAVDMGSARLVNGFLLDSKGGAAKRKGLKQHATAVGQGAAPVGVNSLFWWNDKDIVLAIKGTDVENVTNAGAATNIGVGVENQAGNKQFHMFAKGYDASNNQVVHIGGFRHPTFTDGATVTQTVVVAGNDQPEYSSHAVYIDRYLIMNSLENQTNRRRFYFSAVGDPTSWPGEFVEPESDSDFIMALHQLNGDLIVFGSNSIERFYNDGITPWVRYDNVNVNVGTLNPYTIQAVTGGFIFLDNNRRVVFYDGNGVQSLSEPIDRLLDGPQLTTSTTTSSYIDTNKVFNFNNEPFAYTLEVDGKHLYAISFPNYLIDSPDNIPETSGGRTFVYDIARRAWYEWGIWVPGEQKYTRWTPGASAYRASEGEMHLGAHDDEVTFLYSNDSTTKHTDNETSVRFELRSPHIDEDTYNRKRYNRLRMHLEESSLDTSKTTGTVTVGFTDDGVEYFESGANLTAEKNATVTYPLASDSERARMTSGQIVEARNLGMGRRRQWNLIHEDNADLTVNLIEEEADVMTN